MSNNTFEILGRIKAIKETEKFKPYEETKFDSGWVRRSLKFNAIAGTNRHMLNIDGGSFADGHGDVFLFSKKGKDTSGNAIKGESFRIPFKDRLTSPKLAEVAEFKKMVIDLELPNRRYLLEKASEKIKDGTSLTDEELKAMGLENESQVNEALEKSKKKRHEFVSEWDFIEYTNKVLVSEKYANKKFKITGNLVCTYSDKNEKFYINLVPSRIYLANQEDKEYSIANLELYYGKDSLDSGSLEEKGRYYVNGYVFDYDNSRKGNIPCPMTIALAKPITEDEKELKRFNIYLKQFNVEDDTYKKLGVVVDLINGSQLVDIDESMLTDLQKDLLDLGEITMDDIRKEIGGNIYGDKVQENLFVKLARGYSKGAEPTTYIDEDFVIKAKEDESSNVDEEIDELFPEDDDDDLE